eukprot:3028898-Rhodomonas_salina.1
MEGGPVARSWESEARGVGGRRVCGGGEAVAMHTGARRVCGMGRGARGRREQGSQGGTGARRP